MLKLLKNFFSANNNSTPSEWTDEGWNADSYEKMLTTAASTGVGSMFGGNDGGGLFGGMFEGTTNTMLGDDAMSGTSMFDDTSRPMFNIDGTPMVGDVDIHGNFYGMTSSHSTFDTHSSFDSGSSWSSSSDSFGSSWSSDSHF